MNVCDATPPRPPTLTLVHRGRLRRLTDVPPDRTLLALLREDLGLTSVKEGCASGDCGACTVAVADRAPDGTLRWRALNSCIRLAHAAHGCAVWTAEDLTRDPLITRHGALHPAQQALVDAHGTQCGFCTPGFVMSLFVRYQRRGPDSPLTHPLTREEALQALSGNLCRCTGYRPILDAAQAMTALPPAAVDEAALDALLAEAAREEADADPASDAAAAYWAPRELRDLLIARARWPQARLVAGTTDAGLWITQQRQRLPQVLDVTRCAALQRIESVRDTDGTQVLRIGAAATLHDAFAALQRHWPTLQGFFERFAGQPIRYGGTLGGNVANGSPIGDSMPLLIALGAAVVLLRWDGSAIAKRRLPLEDFYRGYRQTDLAPDEIVGYVEVALGDGSALPEVVAHKVSKRFEDDISAVCLAVALWRDREGRVAEVRIGAGGVAAVPARARRTEATLRGQPWCAPTVRAAAEVLQAEFEPLSDGRASAEYRRALLGSLLWRTWLQSADPAPDMPIRLDEPDPWHTLAQAVVEART